MPNWCMNRLLIEGTKEDVLRFAKHVSGMNGVLDFVKVMPIPSDCTEPIAIRRWCQDNWGTKWTPTCDPMPVDDEELYTCFKQGLFFNTAWTPPVEFFDSISKQFPEISLHLDYLEIGCAFAGEVDWVKGEFGGQGEYVNSDDPYKQIAEEVFGIVVGDEDA